MRCVSVLILISLLACPGLCQNLLLNGSFETAGTGSMPAHWDTDPYGFGLGTTTERIQATDAVDGDYYVRITTTEPSSQIDSYYPGLSVAASNYQLEYNCRYRLTYWGRQDTSGVNPNLRLYSSHGQVTGTNPLTIVETFYWSDSGDYYPPVGEEVGVWKEYSTEIVFGALGANDWYLVAYVLSAFSPFSQEETGRTVDFDNVRLELIERRLSAQVQVTTVTPLVYDYSNTDVIIEFLSNSSAAWHTVQKIDQPLSSIYGVTSLGKHWIIDPLSSTFSAVPTFSYTNTELAEVGLAEDNLHLVRKENDGSWTEVPSVVDFGANTIRPESPVNRFSRWAITSGVPITQQVTGLKGWGSYR